jgi:hypothetical protein
VALADLRAEYESDGIGPQLWELLVNICTRVAHKYPPQVYNDGSAWSNEAARELAQEVTLERLLGENQLDYVFDVAGDEDELARLLAHQVRRVLSRRRVVTVVDRLSDRVRSLSAPGRFEIVRFGRDDLLVPPGGAVEFRSLTAAEIRRGAQSIEAVPRLRGSLDGQRESMVYRSDDLARLVDILFADLGSIALRDLRTILETTLTAWLPTILRDGEVDRVSLAGPELELERSRMAELTAALAHDIDPTQRAVLLGKSRGMSDGALAGELGRSRPWVADRKAEALAVMEQRLLGELPEELHAEATRMLIDELARIGEAST